MGHANFGGPPSLTPSAPWPRWQPLQDRFALVLGIPLRTVSPSHELLTAPSWPPGLDPEPVIRLLAIGDELGSLLPLAPPLVGTASLVTPIGVTYAAASLLSAPRQPSAYVVAGPVIVGPREGEMLFRRRMEAMGRPSASLWPLLLSLKCFTFVGMQAALDLIADVGTALVQGEPGDRLRPEASPQTLLDAAMVAVGAEGGSVMLFEPDSQTLIIRAARGLPDDIMRAARLKRGEGLAGLALEERRALVVDERAEERVRRLMTRPRLTSSLVVPLMPPQAQEPVGALSVWTSDATRRFAAADVERLGRVLALAYPSL